MASARKPLLALGAGLGTLAVAVFTVLIVNKSDVATRLLYRFTRASSSVSLRGGVRQWEGEVIWTATDHVHPLCRQSLTQQDADVICAARYPDRPIKLGTIYAASVLTGQSTHGPVALANFGCTGSEKLLDECPRPFAHDIPATNCPTGAAAIACRAVTPIGENVRLQGGKATEGRLELSIGGNWSSVCVLALDTKLSRLEAKPICKALGLWYSTPAVSSPGEFGAGSGDLVTSVPQCTGEEPDISYCSFRPLAASSICNHTQDAGIRCTVPAMPSSAIQLKGFVNQPWKGALVIQEPLSVQTTGVCSLNWNTTNTLVTCKTAGFKYGGATINPMSSSSVRTKARLGRLECNGTEATLAQCPGYDLINSFQCGPDPKLASVDCSGCGTKSTAEQGSIRVMDAGTLNKDCMYSIRPNGNASLYKLWVDDLVLLSGDFIDVREAPDHDPGLAAGPTTQGPFVLFKNDAYVRVKSSNSTGHRAMLHWSPVTVETVTSLTCTDDDMKIRVNLTELRWLYSDTDPAYISLVNEGCTGSAVGDEWVIDNPHSQCYTQRQIDERFVHYRNALIYKELGNGPIVREHRWRVDLVCNFNRQMQVGLNYALTDVHNYEMNLKSDYSAQIHIYNDSSLNTELQVNQMKAQLGDDLYVNIRLSGHWNVTMHLRDCVARPQPGSDVSYTLIDDGCAVDSQTFIVYNTHNSTLFHFKAFEFYSGFSTVYIDCDVIYCTPLDNSPSCITSCK
ncbi:scavenger receptor cysteine-rich domain-containing protein DMBT1-like [Littorina saxatilis]|uniref:scavenger receptor cysteine-rich domain-containing protein DMBT1-like n=1 Tax=Littorina saxatilis TaxID=31220 RepID=UPI0038B4DB5B